MDGDGRSILTSFKNLFNKKNNLAIEDEIKLLVDAGNEQGRLEQDERDMINNIFALDELDAENIMTHRTDIVGLDVNDKIQTIVYLGINEGFSRLPVYENDIDNIIGVIYVKDLLCLIGCQNLDDFKIKDFMREIIYVPESTKCKDLFKTLSEQKLHMAVVVDEYGGTSGIVTMEDIIESIVGEIQDEYDDDEEEFSVIDENTVNIDGSADIKDVSRQLKTEFPKSNDYDTLGGMITDIIGRIPNDNEHPSAAINGWRFTVLSSEDKRITRVRAEKLPQNAEQ